MYDHPTSGAEADVFFSMHANRPYVTKVYKYSPGFQIMKEIEMQRLCAHHGLSPHIYQVDFSERSVVMQAFPMTLLSFLLRYGEDESRCATVQRNVLELWAKLDALGVFHNDPNLRNYLVDPNSLRVYAIDFGLSIPCTAETTNTKCNPIGCKYWIYKYNESHEQKINPNCHHLFAP